MAQHRVAAVCVFYSHKKIPDKLQFPTQIEKNYSQGLLNYLGTIYH